MSASLPDRQQALLYGAMPRILDVGGGHVTENLNEGYDVVVIGGGAAGLNGAMMLARSRRTVLVVDAGAPRNAPADAVHALLGRDATPPGELLATGRAEVRRYGGQVATGEVTTVSPDRGGFAVRLRDGRSTRARRLLVATGVVDELPDVPGLREFWGRDVVHCPYCHGWEVRDRAIGVLGSSPMSIHQALLFRQLSDDVTYLSHTVPPDPEQAEQFAARGIRVVDGAVASAVSEADRLTGVRLHDGSFVACEAIAVATRMVARADFLTELGLRPVEHPSGMGEFVDSDHTGRTETPGVWVAGNINDMSAQVGPAAAAGAMAAGQINADLVADDTRQAVAAHRAENALPAST
jgi:thioredoxin reductase